MLLSFFYFRRPAEINVVQLVRYLVHVATSFQISLSHSHFRTLLRSSTLDIPVCVFDVRRLVGFLNKKTIRWSAHPVIDTAINRPQVPGFSELTSFRETERKVGRAPSLVLRTVKSIAAMTWAEMRTGLHEELTPQEFAQTKLLFSINETPCVKQDQNISHVD